ncbi:hypothetical protein V9T40_010625 [Parthenolecanium corni]|uniref:Uncharacterized protein n=1 Tax=Parthenolecanium corni TaxID=536013 RepID=A0AAN9XXT9_9HEMI
MFGAGVDVYGRCVQEPQRLAFALLGGAEARNENENERRVFEDGIRSGRSESPERAPTSAAEWLFNFRPIEWLGVHSVYTLRVAAFFRSVVSSVRLFLLRLRLGSIKNIFTDDRGDAAGVPQRVSAFRRFGGAEADALGKRRAAQLANPVTKPTSRRVVSQAPSPSQFRQFREFFYPLPLTSLLAHYTLSRPAR